MSEATPAQIESKETLKPVTEMPGFQSRVLHVDQTKINPEEEVKEFDPKKDLQTFEKRDYTIFQNTSDFDRTYFWQEKAQADPLFKDGAKRYSKWSSKVVDTFTNPELKSQVSIVGAVLGGAGIDISSFNTSKVDSIHERYFQGRQVDGKEGVKLFVDDVLKAYTKDGQLDQARLKKDLPSIRWFASLFGQPSAEIVTQLIDGESQLKKDPDAYGEKVKGAVKKVYFETHKDEAILLQYLIKHKDFVLPKPKKPTKEEEEAAAATAVEQKKKEDKKLPFEDPDVVKQMVEVINNSSRLSVIKAGTGSGKTVELTGIIAREILGKNGKMIVTEPARANLDAHKTFKERLEAKGLNWEIGKEIGWQHGEDQVRNKDNPEEERVTFFTEGVFLHTMMDDPTLDKLTEGKTKEVTVFVDEAHTNNEQLVQEIFALRYAMEHNPKVKVVIVSATMDENKYLDYFRKTNPAVTKDLCYREVPGRAYDVERKYNDQPHQALDELLKMQPRQLTDQLALDAGNKVKEIIKDPKHGNIVTFLPGKRELGAFKDQVKELEKQGYKVFLLHSGSSEEEVNEAKAAAAEAAKDPSKGKVVIGTTTFFMTGVTVDGVSDVVLSGIGRQKVYDEQLKMEMLRLQKFTQAELLQMLGRAGRTQEGKAHFLYQNEAEFKALQEYPTPSMQNSELPNVVLSLKKLGKSMGFTNVKDVDLITGKLPPERVDQAEEMLVRVGALNNDAEKTITPLGEEMLKQSVDFRLARAIIEARGQGCLDDVITIAAIIDAQSKGMFEDMWYVEPPYTQKSISELREAFANGIKDSDFRLLLKIMREFEAVPENDREVWCKARGLSLKALETAEKKRRKILERNGTKNFDIPAAAPNADAIDHCMTKGYQDRIMDRNMYGTFRMRYNPRVTNVKLKTNRNPFPSTVAAASHTSVIAGSIMNNEGELQCQGSLLSRVVD
jgi:HrpA-like RNA helicase